MDSIFIAAMLMATPIAAPARVDSNAVLDRQCFGLMASMADEDDPRVRALGRVAAQYFLGRIDAASPGVDPASLIESSPEGAGRDQLLDRCGDAMQAGGRDFRSIGQELRSPVLHPSA